MYDHLYGARNLQGKLVLAAKGNLNIAVKYLLEEGKLKQTSEDRY
jgi:hypothetical protein